MKIRELVLSMSVMASIGAGCVVEVASRSAYEGCSGGQTCGGSTTCTTATFTTGGPGSFCTTSCANGAVCPSYGSGSVYLPTCVVNTAGIGQCYDTCATNGDCGIGTQCLNIQGTGALVCVPIGTGTVQPNVSPAYSGACTPTGGACAGATTCATASFTTGGAGTFCTATCTVGGTQCPDSSTSSAYLPTCVVNGATGLGQCYDTCASNTDCSTGTQCAVIPGTANRICVPIGTGGTTTPPLPAAYTSCTPAGGACGSSTTCTPAAYVRAGGTQGNLCTVSCNGSASTCPGYVPGAARQSVECVVPNGSSVAQCLQLCNSEADCTPYFTHCATVQMPATGGTLSVCLP